MKTTFLALLLLFAVPGFCKENYQKLTVTGSSVVYKPSDTLNMTIGVVTQNKDVKAALASNAEKMTSVFESLKQLGLTEKEYRTGTYSISPQYTPQPQTLPPNWHPEISGYEVRNTIIIRTSKLDLASDIINTAGKNSVNLIENVSFSITNEEAAKSEVISQAVKQARVYAEAAAKAAGVTLGPIHELTINPSTISPYMLRSAVFKDAATPISPGEIEISSNVLIVYELLQ